MKTLLKTLTQQSIRSVHTILCDKGLPTKIGVYFHSITADEYAAFQEMAAFFRDEGYRVADPSTFLADPAEKCVYISFDDNYRAWYDALPLFAAADITATFFTNTCCFRDRASESQIAAYYDRLDFDGERIPLSTTELQQIAAAGHTIGAHTHEHHCLTKLSIEDAREDIRRGKLELEALLGHSVDHFSYPYGMRRFFSEALRDVCRELGFKTVTNAIPGVLHRPQTLHGLNRTLWHLDEPLSWNVQNLRVDGQHFESLTGRSVLG